MAGSLTQAHLKNEAIHKALLDFDVEAMTAACEAAGVSVPREEALIVGMHKARLFLTDLPAEEQTRSERWLIAGGYRVMPILDYVDYEQTPPPSRRRYLPPPWWWSLLAGGAVAVISLLLRWWI